MSSVHYFQRYSQRENLVTNNSLLFISKLHGYSRLKFEKFISMLCADEDADPPEISLHFKQQIGTGASVLDGYIYQDSFKLAIETKLGTSFGIKQLRKHLSYFKAHQPQQYLLLLCKRSNTLSTAEREALSPYIPPGTQLLQASFEDVIAHFRACLSEHDEEMLELAEDFEAFCSEMKILDTDSHTIFVPPCSRSHKENILHQLYYCPASWNRRHSTYLGVYADKAVRAIGRISKVVTCTVVPEENQVDNVIAVESQEKVTLTKEEIGRIVAVTKEAKERNGWDLTKDTQFFLCDEMVECRFNKNTHGGIQGHRYINIKDYLDPLPGSLTEIVNQLSKHTWP